MASGKLSESSSELHTDTRAKDDGVHLLQHHTIEPGGADLDAAREIIATHVGPKTLIALPPKVRAALAAAAQRPLDAAAAQADAAMPPP